MTRATLTAYVRRAVEELPPELQEAAIQRATGAPVVCWTNLPIETLSRLYGAARAVAMINGLA